MPSIFKISDGFSTFMSGGLASFCFWFMAIPADNIKKYDFLPVFLRTFAYLPLSRMMAAPLDKPRKSVLSVVKTIMREDGSKGFVRGLTPVVIRAFPVNASALFVYEGLMDLMGAEKVSMLPYCILVRRLIEFARCSSAFRLDIECIRLDSS